MTERKDLSASEKMKAAGPTGGKERRPHPFLILVLGFVSAFLLLGCCVCGGALWWFRPRVHEDPERAHQLLAEIVDIRIPDSYQPHGTIEWNLGFLMSLQGVYYERFVGDGVLAIVEVNSRFRNEGDVRRHIRETLLEEGGGGAPLVIDDSETRRQVFEIRGQQTPFTFEVGRDPPSNRVFHIVEGVFEGKSGEVLLSLRVDADHWDEDSIVAMIRSIGRPENDRQEQE